MNFAIRSILIAGLWIYPLVTGHFAKADNDHDEDRKSESKLEGAGKKAVTNYSDKVGIQLSSAAQKTISLRLIKVQGQSNSVRVPISSLVFHSTEIGVYRFRGDYFKLIDVEVIKRMAGEATVQTLEIKPGDQIVIEGSALLRVTELDQKSGPGDAD